MSNTYVMLIDLDSCSGCHACSVSCKAEHRVKLGSFRHRVQYVESGAFPVVSRKFVPTLCQQCTDAPCIQSCPVGAILQSSMGAVIIDQEVCVGSGTCVEACPYGAIHIDATQQLASKCDFCQDRLSEGEAPSCVQTCPTDAIVFGGVDTPVIQQQLASGLYSQWEPIATGPRVWYKGLDKSTKQSLGRINQTKEEQ